MKEKAMLALLQAYPPPFFCSLLHAKSLFEAQNLHGCHKVNSRQKASAAMSLQRSCRPDSSQRHYKGLFHTPDSENIQIESSRVNSNALKSSSQQGQAFDIISLPKGNVTHLAQTAYSIL